MGYIEIENETSVDQVGAVGPSDMDDDEVLDAMVRLIGEAKEVEQQIEDHKACPREEGWEIRARTARRHMVKQFEVLRAEAILRGIPNLPDINPGREKARLDRVAKWQRQRGQYEARQAARAAKADRSIGGMTEGQIRHQREAAEQSALKTRRLAERRAILAAAEAVKFTSKAALFLEPAREILPKDDRTAIWSRAREMFPDHPTWTENSIIGEA